MNYDDSYAAYMAEVEQYLAQVDRGRRVAGFDPYARQFSPAVEDQRQAQVMGVPYQAPPQATAPYDPRLSPPYGFIPTPRPTWAPYADQVGRVLSDPRLSAVMAPGMALVKAPGAAYRAGQALHGALQNERGGFKPGWFRGSEESVGRDPGGFHIPIQKRLENDPNPMVQNRLEMTRQGIPFDDESQQLYMKTHYQDVRGANQTAQGMDDYSQGYTHMRKAHQFAHENASPEEQVANLQTRDALRELASIRGDIRPTASGGQAQPEMLRRLFGFKK